MLSIIPFPKQCDGKKIKMETMCLEDKTVIKISTKSILSMEKW